MLFTTKCGRALTLCALVASGTVVRAQTLSDAVPTQGRERLIVPEGAPLRVILAEKLRFKKNQPVHGRIVEPVYAFDREVVPAGAEVSGHITGFKNAPRWMRITSMLGGNFTPLREPQLTFDTLDFEQLKIDSYPDFGDSWKRYGRSFQYGNGRTEKGEGGYGNGSGPSAD